MAKPPKTDAKGVAGAGGGKTSAMVALGIVGVALAFAVALPSILLLAIGMLPTFVVFLIDDSENHCAGRSVGTLNFCGVAPYLGQLWLGMHSLDGLVEIISDVYAWLFMYGAAALGWLLHISMPSVATMFLTVRDERRVAQLRARQRTLIQDWGPGVGRRVENAARAEQVPPDAAATEGGAARPS